MTVGIVPPSGANVISGCWPISSISPPSITAISSSELVLTNGPQVFVLLVICLVLGVGTGHSRAHRPRHVERAHDGGAERGDRRASVRGSSRGLSRARPAAVRAGAGTVSAGVTRTDGGGGYIAVRRRGRPRLRERGTRRRPPAASRLTRRLWPLECRASHKDLLIFPNRRSGSVRLVEPGALGGARSLATEGRSI